MIDLALLPAFFALFGQVGGSLLKKAAESHVEKYFGKWLDRAGELGKKNDLQEAMERAYGYWIEATLGYVKGLGYDAEDLEGYKGCFEELLQEDSVGEELAKPITEGSDWKGPEAVVFQSAWARRGCRALPEGFQWRAALAAFQRHVQKQRVLTPELRERLNAENLVSLLEELRRQGGVRPEGDEARYAERMRQKYRVVDLSAMAPPTADEAGPLLLRDVFVPQNVREDPPPVELPRDLLRKLIGKELATAEAEELPEAIQERFARWRSSYAERPLLPALDVAGHPASRLIVLIGDPGSGKSTLTRYLLLTLLEPLQPGAGPEWAKPLAGHLPLLIELRDFIAEQRRGKWETFLEFLHHLGKAESYHLDQTWLDSRLRQGPSLVMFDGLDEIFDPGERAKVTQEIAGFAGTYPAARVVVTSRPVGYAPEILKAAGFRHFAVQDLEEKQIETFARGWFNLTFPGRPEEAELRVGRIRTALERSASVRLLAGNPLLLTIMALIARQQELPRERSRFYEHSAEVLTHHWDVNRHLKDAGFTVEYIGLDDKKEILRRIAFRMQGGPQGLAGNFLHEEDLREQLEGYLGERYRLAPSESKRVSSVLIEQLRSRNYVLCLYGPQLYGFVHRTFLEYFCAAEIVRRLQEDPEYSIDRLIEDFYAPHWQDPAWNEVLRLVCGMVGEAYAGKILEYLSGPADQIWKPSLHREPRHLVLAVQCLSEVRNRNAIESAGTQLLEAILDSLEEQEVAEWQYGSFIWQTFLPALESIGANWPVRQKPWERIRLGLRQTNGALSSPYARLAVEIFSQDPALRSEFETIALAISPDRIESHHRMAALSALGRGWPQNPDVRRLLEERARADKDPDVRRRALDTLISGWPQNPDVRHLLEERARPDEDPRVRQLAISALNRGWPHDPNVRRLLEERAQAEEHPFVRSTVLSALNRGWPQDPDVRRLLEERAQADEDPYVRSTALDALNNGWPQDAGVRRLLEERARADEDSSIRQDAFQRIVALRLPSDAAVSFSRDLDGDSPFLDPRRPLLPEQISKAAIKLGLEEAALRERIAEWSQILGWDLMTGLGAPGTRAAEELSPPTPPAT